MTSPGAESEDWRARAARVAAERAARGLPPTVRDPVILARAAGLVQLDDEGDTK